MSDVPRWRRGRKILGLGIEDMERTRALKMDLEIMQGMRHGDPAREIIWNHAREISDELACIRELRESLREAARRDIEEMDNMMRRARGDESD